MASLCHPWFTTTNLSYWFPIFETSATALCGTTGKITEVSQGAVVIENCKCILHAAPWPAPKVSESHCYNMLLTSTKRKHMHLWYASTTTVLKCCIRRPRCKLENETFSPSYPAWKGRWPAAHKKSPHTCIYWPHPSKISFRNIFTVI